MVEAPRIRIHFIAVRDLLTRHQTLQSNSIGSAAITTTTAAASPIKLGHILSVGEGNLCFSSFIIPILFSVFLTNMPWMFHLRS